ncbi:MAG: alginate lyase family protein [Chloroflexi bacterium]|nr:alginate lyase family protein [Chloroflexota bacterium]
MIRLGLFVLMALIALTACASPTIAPEKPAEQDGLVIADFENVNTQWLGYNQDTQVQIAVGAKPPEGFLPVSKFHTKYTDQWVKPTAGLVASTDQVKQGKTSGKWENVVENNRLVAVDIPHDWSAYKYLTFWAHSAIANKSAIEIVAYSEDDKTSDDDYYKLEIVIDWTGWRLFEIPLKEFAATRNPIGWNKIDYFKIASTGWSHNPNPSTLLYFDAMKLSNAKTESALSVTLPKQHPNLFVNATELAEIKKKSETYDWAKSGFQTIKTNAFMWSTRTIKLPATGGGYYHAGGEDYDITQAHYDLANAARDLALMAQLTGETKYGDKAKEILLGYADKYLSYKIHDKEGREDNKASAGGRATAQGINEAAWVIPLAWAYDLMYDDLTSAAREQIEKKVLRPAAELLMENNEGRHNHQAWYNAGIGVIGFALADKEYVEHALNKKGSGVYYQLKNSISVDGAWYEGSMHYQFYVMQAWMPLFEAAYHAGIDLYQEPGYKALLDFPLRYADTTLCLPVINDGRQVYLGASDRARYYESAYRRLREPRYVNVLRATERESFEALMYGVADLPAASPVSWQSELFAKSGLAVLRAGAGVNAKHVVLNAMGYEGGHSHPDQLGIVFAGLGRTLAPDAGSIKYEDPAHVGWYKQSLAHNVLIVNEKSQARAPLAALDAFASGVQLQVARASTTKSYGGVYYARTILLASDYWVDLTQAESAVENKYDWVYHNYGKFASDLNLQSTTGVVGKANGYEYLSNVRTIKTDHTWRADWTMASDQKVRLQMLGAPGTQIIAADGMVAAPVGDETAPERVPLVIARRQAKTARFVSIVEPYANAPAITNLTSIVNADDATGIRISRGKTTDVLMVSGARGEKRFGEYTLDGNVAWVSRVDDSIQAIYLGAGTRLASDNWAIRLENLATGENANQLGVYIECASAQRITAQSSSNAVTVISLEGLVAGNVNVFQLDEQGNRQTQVKPIANANGSVRFFANPQVVYEIIANP